tara:strand:- start:329 stop:526 length:198 start_codon:yes stop_codon:yes gene_type:complete
MCALFLLITTPLEKLLKSSCIQFLLLKEVFRYFEKIINQINNVTKNNIYRTGPPLSNKSANPNII